MEAGGGGRAEPSAAVGRTGGGLLDRDAELEQLAALCEEVRGGRGRLAVIEGSAGIGKTSLLAALRAYATDLGWQVLWARGSELEREFAFGVARQLFEPALRAGSEEEREALLSGAAALATPMVWIAGRHSASDPGDAFARLHGLYWLTANLASGGGRPLLLAIDDAHQADAASLRFLAYLANRLQELPVLVVVATRQGEGEAERQPLLSLRSEEATELVQPHPLSDGGVGALIERRLGHAPEPRFVKACRAATGGNPFYVGELLRELDGRAVEPLDVNAEHVGGVGPRSIAQAILVRLAALPPAATDLVRSVAVLGDSSPLANAAELAGVEVSEARIAADALAGAGILTSEAELSFTHPIVAAAVASELQAHERAHMHAKAAEMLERQGASAESIAAHLLQAAPSGDVGALGILHAAASDADARGAPDAAIAYLARAFAEAPHGELRRATLVQLGAAEARAGLPAAVEHLREALKLAATDDQHAAVALELGRALMLSGRLGEAVETFERALELELEESSREVKLLLETELVGAARFDPATRPIVGERLARLGLAVTGGTPAERLVLAHLSFEMVYMAEPVEKIVDAATRALGRGRLVREQGTALPITGLPVWALIFCERYDEAQRAADEVLAAARAQGSASGFCLAAAIQATIACRLGDLARAEEWGRAALRPDTPRIEAPMALAALIDALRDIGQLEAANEALRAAGLGADVPDLPIFAVLLGARSGLRLAQGDAEGALADALAVGERAAAWGNRNKTFVQWRAAAALARIALGDLAGARKIASAGVAAARGWGVTRAAGIELRALALASDGGEAIELLQEAAALLLRAGARVEWARVSTDLGEALRRAGMRREARTTLFPALATAVECGAHALAHRARAELRAAGVQEPDAVRTGADALTAGERRVARLAADGLTNPQIAQSLFITTKTVEKHLSNAYRKLEVTSRAHLAERLGPLPSAA